tara:strand:- start:17049 stop:17423 length:375 start_codon:yes stop_codon:yes gene_type:complete
MELVPCEEKYWDFVLSLRNELKEGFVSQKNIGFYEHEKFMRKNNSNYLICLEEKVPIGFIGSVDKDIRIAIIKSHQKKGVGKFMLSKFIEKHPEAFAKVKIKNSKSIALFESCGFKKKYYILER